MPLSEREQKWLDEHPSEECADRLRRLQRTVAALSIAVVALVLYLGIGGYVGRLDDRNDTVRGCGRSKADRAATAEAARATSKAARAQSDYLNLVLEAASVKADVKAAAAVNQREQHLAAVSLIAAARSLESRTGANLICEDVFPKPGILPGT